MPNRLQPALLGGLFFGVLSALPLINLGNCCCLWVMGGGVVAAYLLQANTPTPITAGDGALVGLMAGVAGAVIYAVVSVPIDLMMGPFQRAMFERILDTTAEVPGPAREILESMGSGAGTALSIILGFFFMLVLGVIFSTLGGLLGAVLFQKKTPPSTGPIIDVLPSDRSPD